MRFARNPPSEPSCQTEVCMQRMDPALDLHGAGVSVPAEHRGKLPTSVLGTAIINFTPSWYSVNMGTGVLSILLHSAPHQFKHMSEIGAILYLVNCALFVIFFIISCLRYTLYPFVLRRLINNSAQCMFLGTFPMGLATIVNATVLVAVPQYGHWAKVLAQVLWWIDVILACFSCFGVPFLMFHIHKLSLDKLTGAWLLPVVPAVVAAASGGLVAAVVLPDQAITILVVSYVLWGIGMGVSFLILALYFHRLVI